MRNLLIISLVINLLSSVSIFAQQKAKDFLREGNKNYENKNYADAELNYRKSLEATESYPKAKYNLANSLYQQKKYKEAQEAYESIDIKQFSSETQAQILHNLGNSLAQQKEWAKSIEKYKEALRINPKDDETRYNLRYALEQLKKEEQQKQNQDKQDKQENQKEKNQDNKDQDNKDQDNKDQNKENDQSENSKDQQGDQKQQDKGKDGKEKPQQQGASEPKMSKQEAERLLNAIEEKDKKTADKVEKKKVVVRQMKVDKDW